MNAFWAPQKREPRRKWEFKDNGLTGIIATKDGETNPSLILPYNLADEQRDLVLWGYEAGLWHGLNEGKEKVRRELRQRELRQLIGAARQ